MDSPPPNGPRSGHSDGVLTLNGEVWPWSGGTISKLLQTVPFPDRGAAVEVNGLVIPRTQHGEHFLAPGDQVEIVRLVGGG